MFIVPHNLIKICFIADIAMFCDDRNVQFICAFKRVEAQPRISLIPLPGTPLARMKRRRLIAELFQLGSQRKGIL